MTLSYPYNPASLDIISDAAAHTVSDGRFLPFSPLFTGTAASHPSNVRSSIQTRPRASFLPLCFISSAWLKSSNNQSVFLESALPAIPSIRLYIELWFSLWMGFKKRERMLRNSSAGREGASSSKDMAVRNFQVSPGWTVCSLFFYSICPSV